MPVSHQYKAPFQIQEYYHLTFRSIDGLFLFHEPGNHEFFLQKFDSFLSPVLSCFAYCLLKNHVHFIVQVNEQNAILESLNALPEEKKTIAIKKFINGPANAALIDEMIERQVNSFMISYVNALNKSLYRKGSLFQSPFRRVQIGGDSHLQQAIIYTHANAQRHEIVKDFKEYEYTSYHDIISGISSIINVPKVLNFFGGRERFIKEHAIQVQYYYNADL